MAEILRKNIIIDVETDLSDFRKKDKEVKGRLKGLGSSIKTTAAAFAGMFAAQGALALISNIRSITSETIKLADVQLKTEAKLLQALKGRQGIQQRLIKQASELQQRTLFGDEQTIEAQARLATILGANENAIKSLTPLVQDLAAAQGIDLAGAAKIVGQAVGTTSNPLMEFGILVEGAVGSSERLESAVIGLTAQVGGQATAAFESGSGAVQAYENVVGDLKEALGGLLLPVVNRFAKSMTKVVQSMIDFINPAKEAEQIVRDTQEAFNLEIEVLKAGNISQEQRVQIIDKINKQYSEYLPNLLDEKSAIEDIAAAQVAANQAFQQKIIFVSLEEALQKVIKEGTEATREALELERERIALQERFKQAVEEGQAPTAVVGAQTAQLDFLEDLRDKNIDAAAEVANKQQEIREEFRLITEGLGFDLDSIIARFGSFSSGFQQQSKDNKEAAEEIFEPFNEIERLKKIRDDFLGFIAEAPEDLFVLEPLFDQLDRIEKKLREARVEAFGLQETPLLESDKTVPEVEIAIDSIDRLKLSYEELLSLGGEGSTFIQRLAEDFQDPIVAEAFETVKGSIFEILEAQQIVTDGQIRLQEERVAEFKKIAEDGSAEQLQLEEERLNDLIAKREQAAQRQKAIAAVEIATNTATSISSGIKAIIDGFAKGGLIVGIAQSIALASTVVAGVIGIKNAIGGIPAFAEGTEYLEGPGTHKSDSILIRASKGERIVPADVNAQLGGIPNDDLPLVAAMMSGSPHVRPGSVGSPVYNAKTMEKLVRETRKTNELLQGLGMSVEFNEKGLYARFMKNVQDQSRKNSVIS